MSGTVLNMWLTWAHLILLTKEVVQYPCFTDKETQTHNGEETYSTVSNKFRREKA